MDVTAWLVGGLCILANLIVTTVVGYVIKSKWEKHAKQQDEYQKLKDEKHRKERKADVLTSVGTLLEPIDQRLQEVEKQLRINSEGTCAGLRHHLLTFYYDCYNKGYRTKDDSENFTDMYDAYVKMGGNSFIQKDVSKWFYELPSEEQFKGEHK